MAQTFRLLYRQCNIGQLTKPVTRNFHTNTVRILGCNGIYYSDLCYKPSVWNYRLTQPLCVSLRNFSTPQKETAENEKQPQEPEPKKGLIQRFKDMYKNYWYVLVPVHLATSAVWLGGLYYAVRSGVDVLSLLESLGISEKLMEPLRNSGAGYYALTFALYKLVAPLRYAVTLGGTTYTINKLTALGLIKPVPSTNRMKEMIKEKKDNLQDKFNERKEHIQCTMREKRTQVMDEMNRYKSEIRKMKNKSKNGGC